MTVTYSCNKWHWFITGLSIVFILSIVVMPVIIMYRIKKTKGKEGSLIMSLLHMVILLNVLTLAVSHPQNKIVSAPKWNLY